METIRRGLLEYIPGLKISEVKVFCEKSFLGPTEMILGAEVRDLRRFGKALIIDLDNKVSIICHLRMTGQMIYRGKQAFAGGHPSESFVEKLPNKQTRVEIEFGDGSKLFFNDQRKFGFMKPVLTEEVLKDKFIASLAPEPFMKDCKDIKARRLRR